MISLREALITIHRDPLWWRKVLLGGALMLSVVGYPFAAGLVMVSMENSRKGFPSPLPPWFDWSTRYLIGVFAMLIDFVFFMLPVFITGILFLCAGMAALMSSSGGGSSPDALFGIVGGVTVVFLLSMFFSSVSPIARLVFADKGSIEEALTMRPLHLAFEPAIRMRFFRARLASLLAYLPALLIGALLFAVAQIVFPGHLFVLLLLAWLLLSAVLYAHLVIVQLYVAAEHEPAHVETPIWSRY